MYGLWLFSRVVLLVVADKPLRQRTLLDKKIPCLWLALCLYGKSQRYDFTQSHPQKGDKLFRRPAFHVGLDFRPELNLSYHRTFVFVKYVFHAPDGQAAVSSSLISSQETIK